MIHINTNVNNESLKIDFLTSAVDGISTVDPSSVVITVGGFSKLKTFVEDIF
jgi:hypothetical protein